MNCLINNSLSHYLCPYIKGIYSEQALLTLIEGWRKIFGNKGFEDAILMIFFKTFDTLKNYLLIVKLDAYDFQHKVLKLIVIFYSYLTNT